MRKFVGIFSFLLIVFCNSFSQEKNYVFSRMSRETGLRTNITRQVLKDHQGIIWLATNNGLHWYDGQRMSVYINRFDDSNSLSDNTVQYLLEDKHQRLWVVTAAGPAIYNRINNNFLKIPIDTLVSERQAIAGLGQDSKGNVWVTLATTGPYFYDSVKKQFLPYTRFWPKSSSVIHSMVEDPNTGYYWLATDDGFAAYDPSRKTYYRYGHNPLNLPCFNDSISKLFAGDLYLNENCEIWMSGWMASGAYYMRYNTKTKEWRKLNLPVSNTYGFFTDKSGTTWAWGEHLSSYDEKTNSFVPIPEKKNDRTGIEFDQIHGLYEDDESNLWVSTDAGTYIFNPKEQGFTTVDIWSGDKGAVDGNVNGFIETNDKKIIVLTWGGNGLYFFDEHFNRIPDQYGFSRSSIKDGNYGMTWCGLQDREGFIWIGCQSGRVLKINPEKKHIQQLNPPEFEAKTIRCMAEDTFGNIWFGTQNNLIVKWIRSENKFKQIVPFEKTRIRLGPVFRMIPGFNNDIWATSIVGGLTRIDIQTDSLTLHFARGKIKNNTPPPPVGPKDLVFLNKDTMAIATSSGIELFDLTKLEFTNISEKDGLSSKIVISLAIDEEKNIWFTTVNGVSRLRLPEKQVTNFGFRDGITEEGFFYGSANRFSSGKMAFGNSRGFVYFEPKKLNLPKITPDARITGLLVFNKPLSVDSVYQYGNQLRLNYDQNFITLRFSAMTFLLNDKLDYYYQLEGADKDWVTAGPQREVNYSYLPAGDYVFKVKAVSKDGIPSRNINSLMIRIIAPFWKTWWFYLLVTAAIAALLYLIYRLRINRILAVEKVRKRVARDLHDDMGSTLSTINILSEMAKMKVNNDPTKTSEYIGKISDNSARMMEAIDDIVWSINPMNDSMQKITARMREFATSVLEAKDIEIDFKVEEAVNDLTLNMEARRDFFLIFKEAVNNIAKYSKCRNATIHISVKHQRLLLEVLDNGIGFNTNNADNGNGLINMRKRADSLKGTITISSGNGRGTQVLLNVPV